MSDGGEFRGKVVVVTGASEGIGRALCLYLAPFGAKLVLAARNEARLQELAAECRAKGSEAAVVRADVARADDCRAVIDGAVAAFGGIDVLVNNAGITMWADFDQTTDPALIARVMEVNYFSLAYCTLFALPHLKKSRGRIVGVSSIAGIIGVPGHAIYGASKHAIHGFLDSLRIELEATGVTVTIVSPDFVVTEIHDRGLRGDGSTMHKRLDPSRHMSAEECARIMADAIARRERIVMTSPRGRLAMAVRGLFPQIVDKISAKQAKKSGVH